MANYDHIGWQNRFSFGNDNIYPKCASKKVSEMEISRISWKHIFNKLPLIQMRIDLVQIVTFAYINGTQTYEAYLTFQEADDLPVIFASQNRHTAISDT